LFQTVGPAASVKVVLSPSSILANGTSRSTATATVRDAQSRPLAGQHVRFAAGDAAVHFGNVTDHRNGIYTATLTSSRTPHAVRITAVDSSVSPNISGHTTLTQTATAARPLNTALPAISGSTVVARTLSASRGTWSGTAPISYAYQWQRCKRHCANIAGAKRRSYKLGVADAATKLQVVVTATNRYGATKAFSRRQVGPVLTAGQLTARLMSVLVARGSGARIAALLKLGGYRFSFSSPGSTHLAISWYRPASAPGAQGKGLLVASVSAGLQGTSSVKLALTAKGRQALKRAKHLRLTAHGTLSLTGGPPIAATRSFTVTR
jgi:fibronectin-binding autotransporter adhesin